MRRRQLWEAKYRDRVLALANAKHAASVSVRSSAADLPVSHHQSRLVRRAREARAKS